MKKKKDGEPRNRISITFTALIWTGILLCIFGSIVAVLGLNGSTTFEIHIKSAEVKTTQVGLVILIAGVILSFFTAQRLPPGVIVLGDEPTFTEKLVRQIPIMSVVTGIIAIILLFLSFFFGK